MELYADSLDPCNLSSRNFEDDQDHEETSRALEYAESNQAPPVVTWCKGAKVSLSGVLQASQVVLAVGIKPILYLRCLFEQWEREGTAAVLVGSCILSNTSVSLGPLDPEDDIKSDLIYARTVKGSTYVYVILGSAIPQTRMFSYASHLFTVVSAARYIILDCIPPAAFTRSSDSHPEPPVLFRLLTTHAKTQAAQRKQERKQKETDSKTVSKTDSKTEKAKQGKKEKDEVSSSSQYALVAGFPSYQSL